MAKRGCEPSFNGSGSLNIGWIDPAFGELEVSVVESSAKERSISPTLSGAVLEGDESGCSSGGVSREADGIDPTSSASLSSMIRMARCSRDAAGAGAPVNRSASSSAQCHRVRSVSH